MVLFVWRFTKLIVRIKRRNETKRSAAKADESQRKPRSLFTGTCMCRWLLSLAFAALRFVLFRFVSPKSVQCEPALAYLPHSPAEQ